MNRAQTALWYAAVATFGFGDIVTTANGLEARGVHEAHPLSASILADGGPPAMIAVKVGVLAAAFVAYQAAPDEYADGIPIGLVLVGVAIVAHNVNVLDAAGVAPR